MESKLYYKNDYCTDAGKVEWFDEDPGIDYIEIGDKRDAIELAQIWEKSDRHFLNKIAANIKKEVLRTMPIIHHHIDEIQHASLTQDELTTFIDSLVGEGFDYETVTNGELEEIWWWNEETPENESHGRAHVKIIEEEN